MKSQTFHKIATGQIRFKPFDGGDWSAFSGAEAWATGEEPMIACAAAGDVEFILIADAKGLAVSWVIDDGSDYEDHEITFHHETANAAQAVRLFRSLLSVCADTADLVDLGFVEVL